MCVLGSNCKSIRVPTVVFNLGRCRSCLGVLGSNCKSIRVPTKVFNLGRFTPCLGVFSTHYESIRVPTKVFNLGRFRSCLLEVCTNSKMWRPAGHHLLRAKMIDFAGSIRIPK